MRSLLGNLVLASVFSLALSGRAYAAEPTHTKDTLDTVKQNLKDGKAVLVDVREQKEWDEGHIAGAVLMPKSKLEKEAAELAKKLDKNKIVYTHCRAGKRALACGEILKKQGFDVRALKPGYEELLKAGFEKAK
ncbi:MAG: rhodanese-like domain-containing protein [Planctomycetales bacterium]|nr:rhodanese-like domain-containing protein [Planctomycetales bacterium]